MKTPTAEFIHLMQTVADGWTEGDAQKSAACFSEDAIYVEPPDNQLYHGRHELYEFFGGDQGQERPMEMTWHHLAFNKEEQIGFGEYTFQMINRHHGIVAVRIEAGLIKGWREYQYKSELNWGEFIRQDPF